MLCWFLADAIRIFLLILRIGIIHIGKIESAIIDNFQFIKNNTAIDPIRVKGALMISESTFDTKKDIAPVSVVILDINCPDLLC